MTELQELPQEESGGPQRPRRRTVVVILAVAAVLAVLVAAVVVWLQPIRQAVTGGSASPTSAAKVPSAGLMTSAGYLHNWGDPTREDEFDGSLASDWEVYDGPGHVNNGRRSPSAITTSDGLLTITGDSEGTTGGMAWSGGQKSGRWEARVKAPASDPTYHALLLLWPDAEDWPEGGEIDFMEMLDPKRQTTLSFVHWSKDNKQDEGQVDVDATQWHNWAVEWTPQHIVMYLDGREWYRTDDKEMLPPRPMHLAIQLDWFPDKGDKSVKESEMQVDWVKEWAVP